MCRKFDSCRGYSRNRRISGNYARCPFSFYATCLKMRGYPERSAHLSNIIVKTHNWALTFLVSFRCLDSHLSVFYIHKSLVLKRYYPRTSSVLYLKLTIHQFRLTIRLCRERHGWVLQKGRVQFLFTSAVQENP